MSEYKFDKQNNVSFPQTFEMSQPAPLVANRIFSSLQEATAYITLNKTAIPGILLRVIEDGDNNGVYFVANIGGHLELQRMAMGQVANDGHLIVKLGDKTMIDFSANEKNDLEIQLWGDL